MSYLMPMVQIPPRGVWGARAAVMLATVESWIGRPADADADAGMAPDDLVLRYLAAYGPATVNDIQLWCGLTRLGEVAERLRPRLRTFRDDHGRELYDLPDAPRPDQGTPAPPRFLPEYDNVLLSYADRTRLIPDGRQVPLPPGDGGRCGTLLVDGLFRGTWAITRHRDAATLHVKPFASMPAHNATTAAITEEGQRLLAFFAADAASHDIRFTADTP